MISALFAIITDPWAIGGALFTAAVAAFAVWHLAAALTPDNEEN